MGDHHDHEVRVAVAGPDDWQVVRHLRLGALADTPDAFGATLEEEAPQPEEFWRARLGRPDATTLLASWVGDALIEALVDRATEAGFTRLVLDVADTNAPARGLYGRHGFVPTGRTGTLPSPRTHIVEHELARDLHGVPPG